MGSRGLLVERERGWLLFSSAIPETTIFTTTTTTTTTTFAQSTRDEDLFFGYVTGASALRQNPIIFFFFFFLFFLLSQFLQHMSGLLFGIAWPCLLFMQRLSRDNLVSGNHELCAFILDQQSLFLNLSARGQCDMHALVAFCSALIEYTHTHTHIVSFCIDSISRLRGVMQIHKH